MAPAPLPSGGLGPPQAILKEERSATPSPSAPWIPGRRPRGGVPRATGRVATAFPAGSVQRRWEKAPARTLAQVLLLAGGPRPKAPTPSAPPGPGPPLYLQPPAADQARIVHGGGGFGPWEGGGWRWRPGGGKRKGVRSRGDRHGSGSGWVGGGARAEQSGAGPAPSLRLGAPAGLSQRCPRWGRGTGDRREKDPPDNPETAKLPRDPYKERHPRREICSWVDPNSRNAPRHSS